MSIASIFPSFVSAHDELLSFTASMFRSICARSAGQAASLTSSEKTAHEVLNRLPRVRHHIDQIHYDIAFEAPAGPPIRASAGSDDVKPRNA